MEKDIHQRVEDGHKDLELHGRQFITDESSTRFAKEIGDKVANKNR